MMEQSKWQMKMNSIPLKENPDSAWEKMETLLNQQQPSTDLASNATLKKIVVKLVSMLGYVLPAAAMITVGTYVILPKTDKNTPDKLDSKTPQKHQSHQPLQKKIDTLQAKKDTVNSSVPLAVDSVNNQQPLKKNLPRYRSAGVQYSNTGDSITKRIKKTTQKPSPEQLLQMGKKNIDSFNIKSNYPRKRSGTPVDTVNKKNVPVKSGNRSRKSE